MSLPTPPSLPPISDSDAYLLIGLAERFYFEAESPTVGDIRRMFHALVMRDEAALRAIHAEFGLEPRKEQ